MVFYLKVVKTGAGTVLKKSNMQTEKKFLEDSHIALTDYSKYRWCFPLSSLESLLFVTELCNCVGGSFSHRWNSPSQAAASQR